MVASLRSLVLLSGIACLGVAQGQPLWGVFFGPQVDLVNFHVPEETNANNPHTGSSTRFYSGTGWGWHTGLSIVSGEEPVEFKGSVILSRQQVIAPYTRSSRSGGLGGSSSSTANGQFEDLFTTLEAPILLSLGGEQPVRFEVGCSPWVLLDAAHRDHGTVDREWWSMGQGSGSSSSAYDETSGDMKLYSKYGLSGILGVTWSIKELFTVSTSGVVSFVPIYDGQDPYSGHHTMARLSIGYVFKKGWFGS